MTRPGQARPRLPGDRSSSNTELALTSCALASSLIGRPVRNIAHASQRGAGPFSWDILPVRRDFPASAQLSECVVANSLGRSESVLKNHVVWADYDHGA
jgi:hypothetical protein